MRKPKLEFREAKIAIFHWTDYQKEHCTEGKFWRLVEGSHLIFGWIVIWHCVAKPAQGWGKNYWKTEGQAIFKIHIGLRIVCIHTNKNRKMLQCKEQQIESSEKYHLNFGAKLYLDWILLCTWHKKLKMKALKHQDGPT